MDTEFTFRASQYYDFTKQDDGDGDSRFFELHDEDIDELYEEEVGGGDNNGENTLTEADSHIFFTPLDTPAPRRSLSMTDINRAHSAAHKLDAYRPQAAPSRALSKERMNLLAQPKRWASQENVRRGFMSNAEAEARFQSGTPLRFRTKPTASKHQMPVKPRSPKLKTAARIRPLHAISKEEQEILEMQEAQKFKIRARPLNEQILKGPLKPCVIEKKPATVTQPFHLTEPKRKEAVVEENKVPTFRARPVPKALHAPFKVEHQSKPVTLAHSPNFSKRFTKAPPLEPAKHKPAQTTTSRPRMTEVQPFSFEQRQLQMVKKKQEYINKVMEEERKAREFHANPVPKAILRSRPGSRDNIDANSVKHEDLETTVRFKARPATVLSVKPFEPKRETSHVLQVEAFALKTDERVKARQQFEQKRKEQEAEMERRRREQEEKLLKLQEEEVARLRKEMEYKAQPIKKYKEIQIKPSKKITTPISPQFHTDKIRNKENMA